MKTTNHTFDLIHLVKLARALVILLASMVYLDTTAQQQLASNDPCSDAQPIACGDTILGSTIHANSVNTPDTCDVVLNTAPGVWYTILGDGSNITASLCGSSYDTKIGIFANSCNDSARFCIAGNDDACGLQSQVTFPTFPGIPYYIYVTGFDTAVGNFQLAITCASTQCDSVSTTLTSDVGLTSATLSWSPNPSAIYYEILGGILGQPEQTFTVPATLTQLQVNGLSPGATYTWRIRGVCNLSGTSVSPYSATKLFTTLVACDPPANLMANPVFTYAARLNWDLFSGASGYRILGNVLGNPNPIQLDINNPGTTFFDVFNLQPNTSYYWTVVAVCGSDVSPVGIIDTFTTPSVQIGQKTNMLLSKAEEIRVYPNPAMDLFTIELPILKQDFDKFSYQLFDAKGQLVQTGELQLAVQQVRIQPGLSKGMYTLLVKIDEQLFPSKLIIH